MKWLTVFTMLVMVLFLPGIVMADPGTGLKFGGQGYSHLVSNLLYHIPSY